MAEEETEEGGGRELPETTEEVEKHLDELYGELLDANRDLVVFSREKAKSALELRDLFLEQSHRCEEIAACYIRGAQIVGSTFGDVLAHEWEIADDDDESEDQS